jgi:hypothetical protein
MSSEITHEIRITSADRKKIIRFSGKDAPSLWVDLYNCCVLVNGYEEFDQRTVEGVLIGALSVHHSWERVMHIIENDAGLCTPRTLAALAEPETVTVVDRFQ